MVPDQRIANKVARNKTKIITTNIHHPSEQTRIQNHPQIHQAITYHLKVVNFTCYTIHEYKI